MNFLFSDSGSDEEPDHDYARPDQATPGVHQSGELAPERDGGLAPVRGDVSVSPQTALCAQPPPTDHMSLPPPKRASFTQENKSKPKRQPHWKSSKESKACAKSDWGLGEERGSRVGTKSIKMYGAYRNRTMAQLQILITSDICPFAEYWLSFV